MLLRAELVQLGEVTNHLVTRGPSGHAHTVRPTIPNDSEVHWIVLHHVLEPGRHGVGIQEFSILSIARVWGGNWGPSVFLKHTQERLPEYSIGYQALINRAGP